MKVIDLSNIKLFDFYSLSALKDVAFAAFSKEGIGNLFFDWNRIILTATAILALLLSVTFDAIGTFIGAGGVNGIFDTEKEKIFVDKKGIDSKFEKALFSYGIAAALSGIFGTSSVTTYIESATGISVGGRTGLTSFVVAILFLLCLPFASIFSIVPSEVTAPALIMVGVLMMSSVMNINWSNLEQAIPAFL
jgi:AGZA family xanthine/uracil permease-like MFS transporter